MENIQENTNKHLNKRTGLGNFAFLLNQKENVEKIVKEHSDIIKFITDAKKNDSKEIFVPVCDNFAYFVGKLKNPNECKVYLGEEYFLKTSSDKAIRILSDRAKKTKEILDNLNKEIANDRMLLEKKTQDTNIEKLKNLKQLHDDSFEIVEDVSEKEVINLKNKSAKLRISDEEERVKMMKEKLQKIKEFKTITEAPIVLSAVKNKTVHNPCETSMKAKIIKDNEPPQVSSSQWLCNNLITHSNGKKKDIIDSDFPKEIIENNIQTEVSGRSFFYHEDENEM